MSTSDDRLLEPAKSYRDSFKDDFARNAEELFDSLVKKSGVDAGENRKTAAEYRKVVKDANLVGKALGKQRGWRTFLIVMTVICAVAALLCGIARIWPLLVAVLILAVGFLLLLILVVKPKILALTEQKGNADGYAAQLLARAREQMMPLLRLFRSDMTVDLIQKTVPRLVLDKQFDMKRYDYLHGKYGLPEAENEETSEIGLLSGEVLGNPILVERQRLHRMGTETYHGTLVIHWTTYSRDSNGRSVAHHHSQTLTASVTKPKPFYKEQTRLLYGNDAAPDLSFSHEPTHAERMNEKKLKSYVKSEEKKIRKMAEQGVETGFTEMANTEFDAIFNGTERDNEVQFRLLFTPLAQKNLLTLMKGDSPFGDDFYFIKKKCLNYILSEHSQSWDPDTDPNRYASYDIDICKKSFLDFNKSYFEGFYFDMAPLLSIPLYQQQKPREYLYQTAYERNFTAREAEVLANKFGERRFLPQGSATPAILKTDLLEKRQNADRVAVTAFAYRAENRTDFVPTLGGDGIMHAVPVPWVEYIPISKRSEMVLTGCDGADDQQRNNRIPYHRLFADMAD